MRKILMGIFGIFFVFVVTVFFKSGAWKSVEVSEVSLGPLQLVYKDFVGPYHKIVGTIEQVEAWAKTKGLDCSQSFGEYLDDPNVVEHERLRSRGGCVLTEIPKDLPLDFKSELIPNRAYVMGSFSGSPALGPLKVYSHIEDYMESKKLRRKDPVIEIYKALGDNKVETRYLFPVDPR